MFSKHYYHFWSLQYHLVPLSKYSFHRIVTEVSCKNRERTIATLLLSGLCDSSRRFFFKMVSTTWHKQSLKRKASYPLSQTIL